MNSLGRIWRTSELSGWSGWSWIQVEYDSNHMAVDQWFYQSCIWPQWVRE